MKRPKPAADDRQLLLQMIEESYRLPNWNATNLRSALRRVGPEMAAWRPPHAKRSIAEIVVHCAYWKYGLRRRLSGGKRGTFPVKGSNWFNIGSQITSNQWSEYQALLENEHEQLCHTIKDLRRKLSNVRRRGDGQWSSVQRIFWLAIHDGYHTGQINLIKAMYRRAKASRMETDGNGDRSDRSSFRRNR